MDVLVGCEFSGIVRDAFIALGHNAMSVDLLESESDKGPHHVGDIREVLDWGWDLAIIHLPCTYMANSSVCWLTKTPKHPKSNVLYGEKRWIALCEAGELWREVEQAPIARIAMENPIPHKYALAEIQRKYDQIIQPYQFGHGETKKTCLWLKNLPKLIPTNIVNGRIPRSHYESPGPNRWKNRSRTYTGIAKAMAEQWGSP